MTEDTKTLYQRLEEAKAKRLKYEAEAKATKGKNKTKDEVQEHIETANKLRNISAMTSPIGNISTPVDNVAKKFKKDFPSQAAASAAEGLVSGTAKVGSTFTPVEGEVSKVAKKEYEDIAPEVDGFWDRAKKSMMDSLGRGKDGNPTMPQDYFSDYLERKDKKIDASYKEHVLRSTFAALDGVPRDNEGRYLINGMAFTRDELMPSMQREVTAALHPQLMASSGEYRNDYAKSLGFRDFNTYIDETIINPLKALDAEIASEAVEKANDSTSPFPEANMAIRMGVMADAETKGRKEIRDAIDAMESLKRGDWSAAFAEGFDFLNFATLGVSSLGSDINQLRMLNKVKNGEELTSEEQRMYDIYQITQNANALREIVPQTFWQDIWRGIGTTAQLSSQFMPVMGVASSVANLGKVGVKTGIGLTQRALRQGVVKGVMTGIKQTGRVAGKLGLNVLKANWAGLVVSPLQMGTYSTFLQKREEQFKVVDGKLVYTPTKAWKDVVDTLIEQTNEISSEVLGVGIADVVGVSFKSLGKMIGLDKVINGVSSKLGLGASYNKIFGLKKGDAFKAFERRMSYTGDPVSEGLSEIWGDISTNLMKMCITGTEDFSMLRDPKYWATNLAVAGIYGTTLNMAHSAASLPTYADIAHLGKAKHQALRNISSKELKDALRIMGVDETVNEAAFRLAQLNWSSFSPTDRANAMDFLRAESQQQILIGVNEENNYMARFTPVAASIQQHAYRGKEGEADTGLLYEGTLEDGSKVSIISGDMTTESNADNLLMVMGKDGNITPMARSKFKEFSAYRMGDVITAEYQRMYGTEAIKNELSETEETFEALEQPTPKEAMEYMRKLNIPIPEEGGKVKLVDGREGMFLGWNADGSLNVEAQKADDTYELLVMPFHKILSAQGNIAQVQQEMLAGKTLSAAEEAIESETPEAEVIPEAETPEEAQVETATAIEEAQNEVADISAVPVTEDGNVDFEAITDAALYAKMYVREFGSTEVAIDDVSKMRSMAEQSILKLEEKRETLATANERIANRKEVEAMKARIAFYDAVLDILSPKEVMAEPVAETPEVETPEVETPVAEVETPTMETPTFYEGDIVEHNGRKAEVVENRGDGTYIIDYKMSDNASNQDIDIVDGAALAKAQDEVEAAENTVGIVDNAESRKIADDVYNTVNSIAKSLGITVEFVPIVVNSEGQAVNGLIDGKKVLISSQFATECVNWLTGHEFLHYMKSVAPEQYSKYTESVKSYLGEEEWNKRMEKQKALYLNHKMTEKANDEALMTEECVADFTGEMVEENDAFNNYLNTVKEEKGLLAAIKRVLRAIGKLFTGKHKKRVNEMLKQVNALIAAAEKANTEGVKPLGNNERNSLIKEQSAPIFYSNAQYAVQNIKQEKATPEQWLKMIEKNGGLKAGEDKWLGLSDWLKASDKKTLTKDEVLQYIAENDIQIKEVEYAQFGPGLIDEATRKLEAEMREIGIDAMREKYNGFDDLFEVYNNELVWSENMASESEYEDFIIDNNIVDVNAQANAINDTRSGYTTNGLTNKREIALVVPTIEPYNAHDEVHFGDAGGGRAVAWIRFGETTDADGKRVLVIDEIQSKRHQDGREKGYSNRSVSQQELYEAQEAAFSKVIDYESALADKYGEDEWAALATAEEMAEYERLRALDEAATNAYENYDKGVPSAPFEKNWAELAFKRMLRYAAENDYNYVAWTTGDQQAKRYGMLKAVSKIVRRDNSPVEGKRFLLVGDTVVPHKITVSDEGVIVASTIENIEGKPLSEVMGKEVALKMMQMGNKASLESANLRIGGEGMRGFYDQMLPSFVKKYTKKWGAEVGEVTMPDLAENNTMHAVNVTDSMRESVMHGQPKFSLSEETTQIFDAAKAKFGTTYDMREAGYILPDGSMLDFSGRHQVRGGDTSFLNGDRTVDHREISDIAYDNDDNETGISTDLGDFLDRGAIRIDSNAGAINLNVAPTKAQKDRLKRLIERNDGYVYIDFGKGWDTEHYAEYEAARASRVLGDIDRYFDEGIKPTGNVRYSLSNLPTGLFNDFAEEFEALQKEYESLDPTTIHAQHPFRIRKRKVVQKYVDYVSRVLGNDVVNIVYDKANNAHVKKVYDRIVAANSSFKDDISYLEFKEYLQSQPVGATFIQGTNIIIFNISTDKLNNAPADILNGYVHENVHRIIEKLGIDNKTLEDILEEGLRLLPNTTNAYIDGYQSRPKFEQGEETLAYSIGNRMSNPQIGMRLLRMIEGYITFEELNATQKILLPLRDSYIEKILNELQNEYKAREEGADSNSESTDRNGVNGEDKGKATQVYDRRWRGYSETNGYTRGGVLDETRYSLPDMPFFEDNGDIVAFEAMTPEERKMAKYEDAQRMTSEGADAQAILDATGWLETEDGWEYFGEADIDLTGDQDEMLRVGRWLQSKRAVKKSGMRKMYAELIKEQRDVIKDIKKREAEAFASRGSIKAQVEAFLQGQVPESLSIEDQVLVDIARGQRLKWKDGNGKRGLSTELGLTNARAEKMGAVTIGATDYLEDYVAALMERNNGYDNDINDNDIRNAVIEMFRSYPSPKRALDELYGRYTTSTAVGEAEEGLYRLEVERDNALAEIDAEHNATMANFEANPAPFIREYNESAAWQAEIDMYTNSLRKAKSAIDRMTAGRATESANRKSKAEAVRSLKTFINNMLRGDLARYTHKRDIVALMNAVNESTTIYQMQRAVNKAMESAYNIRLRKEVARMNNLTKMRIVLNETNLDPQIFLNNMVRDGKMTAGAARTILNNYWRGVNASGVAIAKGVDGDTSEIMAFIHENIDLAKLGEKTVAEKCKDLRDAVEGDRTLDEDLKAKKIASVDIIEEYLTLQQMINALREINGSEKPIEQTIAQQATEIAKLNNELRAIEMQKETITRTDRGYKSRKTAIEEKLAELRNAYNTARMAQEQAYASYYGSMPDIIERLYQANTSVEKLLKDGRIELSRQKQAEVDHRNELIGMALEDINRPDALVSDKVDYTLAQKAHDSVAGRFVTSQLNSLDHMLRRAGENAPNGEGRLWKYFVPKLLDAYNRLFDEQQACADIMNKKCKQLFGKDYNKTMMKAESVVIGTRDEVVSGKMKTTDVTIAQALNIIATWDQADGRASLEKQGFTEEKIQELIGKLYANNPKWMAFEQWVVHTFLPSRREKYNKVHRSMFGVNMNKEINYFPIRRKKDDLYQNVDLTEANFDVLPSTITGSIIKRTKSTAKIDLDNSFFEVLRDHIVDMEKWAEMAPITKDFNTMLSSKAVQAVMNAKGKHFLGQFKEAAKIATLNFTGNSPEYEKIFMPIVNRMWASSLLAFKPYTALKQLASSVMFAQYSADPRFVGRLLYYYVGGLAPLPDSVFLRIGKGEVEPQSQKDVLWNIQWAKKNSAMFRERWQSVAAGNEAFTRQIKYDTKLGKFVGEGIKDFTTLGMRMIAFVDAYTSAAGMRAVYDVTYRNLKEKGASHEEAHKEAMLRAEIAVNKTQQSSQFIYLSPIQMSRGFMSMLATFNNAPFAQGRLIAESWAELIRNPEEERRVIVNEEAEWLKTHQYARAYAEIEEQIAAEKANGTLSAEDENKRREELQRVLNASVRAIAEKKAPKIMRGHKVRAALALTINAYIAQFAFNAMEVLPYMLFGDDDEKKKQLLKDVALWSLAGPLSTVPSGNAVISAFQGFQFQPLGAYGDFVDDINQIVKEAKKNGFNADVALMTADFFARKAVGVDYKTYFNLYAGLDSLMEDGYSHEALLKMLNAPNSQVRLLAGERREGETAQQYATRILRLYAILDDNIYEDNYVDGEYTGDNRPVMMSKAQMRNLMPDYEREYRSDVLRRKAGYIKRAEIDAIDEEYAKVMEAMGWTANRRPNKKAFESGKYEAPVSGVRIEEYRKLASLATRVANAYDKTSRYIGDDEGKYYDYILAEMERKQQMISEFNKAINTK